MLFVTALWAATTFTRRFLIAAVLVLTLMPIVGLPEHRIVHPGVIGLIAIAVAGLLGLLPRRQRRMTLIDLGALLVLAGCLLSYIYGHQTRTHVEIIFCLWFCPYFAARSVTGSGDRTAVLKAFAIAGAVAIPIGIVEVVYGNPFLKIFSFGAEAHYGIGVVSQRLGIDRAQGAFGQPIPYSMFLSIAAVCAVTLWMLRGQNRSNKWLFICLGIVAIQATALTRTGWLMLAITAGVVLVLNFRLVSSRIGRRLVIVAVISVGVILAIPKTNALILGTSGSQSVKLDESAAYRSRLIQQALRPGFIDPLGTREAQIGPFGSKSIDDEYVHAAWTWGYLPLCGFAVMLLAFVRGAWRHRKDTLRLSIYAVCIATMIALESVAFLTQQEVLIWLLWGYASGLTVLPRAEALAPSAARVAMRSPAAPAALPAKAPPLVTAP
jgi:hypothetical protein